MTDKQYIAHLERTCLELKELLEKSLSQTDEFVEAISELHKDLTQYE